MNKTLRDCSIGIISDIHLGSDFGVKRGSAASRLFADFSSWADGRNLDFVVDLGDRITDVDPETDRKLMSEVSGLFKSIQAKRFHLCGNHDIAFLTREENDAILGVETGPRSYVLNGWRFIFWSADTRLDNAKGLLALEEDLVWLKNELERSSEPSIIFTHVPLDNGNFRGNFYFEKLFPHHASYPPEQAEEIRSIIEQSGKVVLCINGHAHWNAYHCIDGIHYLTVPSLTETFPTHPEICESWSELKLSSESIRLEVFGNLPIAYQFPVKEPVSRHWVNAHKPYAPRVSLPK